MEWDYQRSGRLNSVLTGCKLKNSNPCTRSNSKNQECTRKNQRLLTHLYLKILARPSALGYLQHQLMTKSIFGPTQEMVCAHT